MAASRKSWRDKLADSKDLPKVVSIDGRLSKRWGEGTVAIPAPKEVDEIMRSVPKGRLITTKEIQVAIAMKHHATMGCPICCGIFAWIAAYAAEECEQAGLKRITPYWRTLKAGGVLNPKFPGGVGALKVRLEAEGHQVVARGKRWVVEDYEDCLVSVGGTSSPKRNSQRSSRNQPAKTAGRCR